MVVSVVIVVAAVLRNHVIGIVEHRTDNVRTNIGEASNCVLGGRALRLSRALYQKHAVAHAAENERVRRGVHGRSINEHEIVLAR